MLLLLFSFYDVGAQRIKEWNDKEENELFIEGTYSLPVSAAIHLISLHDYIQPINPGSEQAMHFIVHAPHRDSFLLKLQERRIFKYYMLESQPNEVVKGINQLGPWKVDDYFSAFNIPWTNLGIVFQVNASNEDHLIPVTLKELQAESNSTSYKAVFRLSKAIRSGIYTVYKGEHPGILPTDKIIQKSNIGRQRAGSVMQISIDKSTLANYTGWVTVQLVLSQQGSTKKLQEKFYFYHASE